jgi:hypothetical protein
MELRVGRKVEKYDGQSVWVDGVEAFELTNWLGGVWDMYTNCSVRADALIVALKCLVS